MKGTEHDISFFLALGKAVRWARQRWARQSRSHTKFDVWGDISENIGVLWRYLGAPLMALRSFHLKQLFAGIATMLLLW